MIARVHRSLSALLDGFVLVEIALDFAPDDRIVDTRLTGIAHDEQMLVRIINRAERHAHEHGVLLRPAVIAHGAGTVASAADEQAAFEPIGPVDKHQLPLRLLLLLLLIDENTRRGLVAEEIEPRRRPVHALADQLAVDEHADAVEKFQLAALNRQTLVRSNENIARDDVPAWPEAVVHVDHAADVRRDRIDAKAGRFEATVGQLTAPDFRADVPIAAQEWVPDDRGEIRAIVLIEDVLANLRPLGEAQLRSVVVQREEVRAWRCWRGVVRPVVVRRRAGSIC